MAAATPTAPREEGTLFGHPKGLAILFLTEMWERFSYYGMRVLLTLYMVNFLFIQPDVGRKVLGFDALRALLEWGAGKEQTAQQLGSLVYGLYTGFVYLTPFIGGLLADRVLGQKRAVILGAVLMAIGHFLMAIQFLFFPALMFLILGNGCFKPNISTQVGALYPAGDHRRDRAFGLFYVGINVGSFFSPIVCGTLGQFVGWHYGFAAAGVGMLVGLAIYLAGQPYLAKANAVSRPKGAKSTMWATIFSYVIFTPVIIAVLIAALSIPWPIQVAVGLLLLAFTAKWLVGLPSQERSPVVALFVLCACTIFFWATYEQQGNTIQLWADKQTDLRIVKYENARSLRVDTPEALANVKLDAGEVLARGGEHYYAIKGDIVPEYEKLDKERAALEERLKQTVADSEAAAKEAEAGSEEALVRNQELFRQGGKLKAEIAAANQAVHGLMGVAFPSTWYQSVNPFVIVLMTPFITWMWARQAKKGKEMSTVGKMAFGSILLGLSFGVMFLAATLAGEQFKSHFLWLVGFVFILSIGELYVSPIGLSLVTKLAPARMVSMLMGVWFLATFFGNFGAGKLGTKWEEWTKPQFFLVMGAIGVGIGLVILLIHRPMHKAISGTQPTEDV